MDSAHKGMEVRFATRLSDNEELVVKTRVKEASFMGASEEKEWRDTTVAQLNMPKVESMCEYIAVYETPDTYYVFMERAEGMDLFEQLQRMHLSTEDAREIIFQMLTALDVMHTTGRIHKDLKLENVVVDLASQRVRRTSSNGSLTSIEAKLIDFDTVADWEPTSPKAKEVLGTDGYIAPEAYSGGYAPASDIYSIGVIMYKVLTGKFPYRTDIFDDQPGENWVGSPAMKRIQNRLMSEKVDFALSPLNKMPDAQDLVKKMMALNPRERPSAAGALRHPWFRQVGHGVVRPRLRSRASTSEGTGRVSLSPSYKSRASTSTASPSTSLNSKKSASSTASSCAEKVLLPGEPE